MIWDRLLEDHPRATDSDERARVFHGAIALWARASDADFAWLATSLEQLSALAFITLLFEGVTDPWLADWLGDEALLEGLAGRRLHEAHPAPRSLLGPMIGAAVRAPDEGTQTDLSLTQSAVILHGASEVNDALLQHLARGDAGEVARITWLLARRVTATAAMRARREAVQARRFLDDTDLHVERILARVLRFDEGMVAGTARETVREAREKALRHPDEAVRAATARQLGLAAVLRRMPARLRSAWDGGDEAVRRRILAEGPGDDADTVAWLTAAVGYPEEDLHWFAGEALLHAPPTLPRPEALRQALVDAAVAERNPSMNGLFVKPAVTLFGADAVTHDLLDRLVPGDEVRTADVFSALYWVGGATTEETLRRRAETDRKTGRAGARGGG